MVVWNGVGVSFCIPYIEEGVVSRDTAAHRGCRKLWRRPQQQQQQQQQQPQSLNNSMELLVPTFPVFFDWCKEPSGNSGNFLSELSRSRSWWRLARQMAAVLRSGSDIFGDEAGTLVILVFCWDSKRNTLQIVIYMIFMLEKSLPDLFQRIDVFNFSCWQKCGIGSFSAKSWQLEGGIIVQGNPGFWYVIWFWDFMYLDSCWYMTTCWHTEKLQLLYCTYPLWFCRRKLTH